LEEVEEKGFMGLIRDKDKNLKIFVEM